MSDNTMVLPGDIPGLLRRGSPVLYDRERFHVSDIDISRDREDVYIARWAPEYWEYVGTRVSPASAALDLTDATGRAHAAWWFNSTSDGQNGALVRSIGVPATSLARVMRLAEAGVAMNDADTSILRDACLRLAGRTA